MASDKIDRSVLLAEKVIGPYARISGSEDDTALRDLLADLRHLADAYGFDWDDELRIAMDNYQAEKDGIW